MSAFIDHFCPLLTALFAHRCTTTLFLVLVDPFLFVYLFDCPLLDCPLAGSDTFLDMWLVRALSLVVTALGLLCQDMLVFIGMLRIGGSSSRMFSLIWPFMLRLIS